MTSLYYNWDFVPLYPLHLFHPFLHRHFFHDHPSCCCFSKYFNGDYLERYSAILWVPEWWTNFFPNMTSYHYTAVRNLNINQEKNYYVSQEFQSSTDFLLILASVQYNKEIWSVSNFCRRNKVRLGAIGFSLHSGIPYFHQHVPRY